MVLSKLLKFGCTMVKETGVRWVIISVQESIGGRRCYQNPLNWVLCWSRCVCGGGGVEGSLVSLKTLKEELPIKALVIWLYNG